MESIGVDHTVLPVLEQSSGLLHRLGHRFHNNAWILHDDTPDIGFTIGCNDPRCQKKFRLSDFSLDEWGLMYLYTVQKLLIKQVVERPNILLMPRFSVFWCNRINALL